MAEDNNNKDFKELLNEQRLTNKLLSEKMTDDQKRQNKFLIDSLKANAAEIINARLLSTKREKFDKAEQMTETDDEIREHAKKQEKVGKKSLALLAAIKTLQIGGMARAKGAKLLEDLRAKERFKESFAWSKRNAKALLKGILDLPSKMWRGFKDLMRLGPGPFTLGRLLGIAVIWKLIKFLNSPEWDKFKNEKFIPFLSRTAEALFDKENGIFAKLDRALWGDDKGGLGFFGHLEAILTGFTSKDSSGWKALGNAFRAFKKYWFGGSGDEKSYSDNRGEDGGIFGGISTINKILLGMAGLWVVSKLLPLGALKLIGAGNIMALTGMVAIILAIRALNEALFGSAKTAEEELARADRTAPTVTSSMPPVMLQKASNISRSVPFNKLTQNRLFNKTSPGAVKTNKGWFWKGVDDKATTQRVPSQYLDKSGNFNEKGYGKSRYGRILDMLPKWVKWPFGWAARKMPAVAAALAGWDAWNIMTTPGLPMEDVPGKPSKLQSLFTLLGNVAGLTAGSIAGGLFGGIPGLLVGAWGGGAAGTHLGKALYEGMWLSSSL